MKTFLILGGNIGDKLYYFNEAIKLIDSNIGKVLVKSSIYETEPWGFESENNFYNQVISVESQLKPIEILACVNEIESSLGRERQENQYSDRVIDIDILFIDDLVIDNEMLVVPHKNLHKRNFVLLPLSEIASDFIHPILKKSIKELLAECDDTCKCEKLAFL